MTGSNGNGAAAAPDRTIEPVDSFKDAAPLLRRPFTPEAVKFKPQTVLGDGKGVLCVAYIDARLVVERLNLVCPHLWSDAYRAIGDGLMWCDLTVDGITRSDVGEGKGKALVSDALKRAAVHFGIGVSLYAIPQQKIWVSQGAGLLSVWKKGDKHDARIEDAGHLHLRKSYREWLATHGQRAFGEPLDHGDAEGSQGDAEAHGHDVPPGVDANTGEIVPEPAKAITKKRAEEIVDGAWTVGIEGQLQLAASHAHGDDVGDCSTKGAATEALRKLTDEQATKVERWLLRKADEQAASQEQAA